MEEDLECIIALIFLGDELLSPIISSEGGGMLLCLLKIMNPTELCKAIRMVEKNFDQYFWSCRVYARLGMKIQNFKSKLIQNQSAQGTKKMGQ